MFTISLFMTACKKDEVIVTDTTPIVVAPTAKILLSGTFVKSGNYSVSGTAKIIEDVDGKKYLVMENLKSDSSPDLRVYLSTDTGIKVATQILEDVPGGNSKTALPPNFDFAKQNTVLIWCQKFSVLFGNAALK